MQHNVIPYSFHIFTIRMRLYRASFSCFCLFQAYVILRIAHTILKTFEFRSIELHSHVFAGFKVMCFHASMNHMTLKPWYHIISIGPSGFCSSCSEENCSSSSKVKSSNGYRAALLSLIISPQFFNDTIRLSYLEFATSME